MRLPASDEERKVLAQRIAAATGLPDSICLTIAWMHYTTSEIHFAGHFRSTEDLGKWGGPRKNKAKGIATRLRDAQALYRELMDDDLGIRAIASTLVEHDEFLEEDPDLDGALDEMDQDWKAVERLVERFDAVSALTGKRGTLRAPHWMTCVVRLLKHHGYRYTDVENLMNVFPALGWEHAWSTSDTREPKCRECLDPCEVWLDDQSRSEIAN